MTIATKCRETRAANANPTRFSEETNAYPTRFNPYFGFLNCMLTFYCMLRLVCLVYKYLYLSLTGVLLSMVTNLDHMEHFADVCVCVMWFTPFIRVVRKK